MAIADSNENALGLVPPPDDHQAEVARARQLATRYRREFVDMDEFRIDQELFRSIPAEDRKSTRLNSSHSQISYAVFCLKKKKQHIDMSQSLHVREQISSTGIIHRLLNEMHV